MNKQDLNNKFYNEPLRVEDWNNPPDSIFDKVIAEVGQKNLDETSEPNSENLNDKFYNETLEVDAWNNPPDLIFSNAIAEVKTQKALETSNNIQTKFYNDTLEVDDWNNPPDLILSNAISEVNKQKNSDTSKRILKAALLGLLISLAGLGFYVHHQISVHNSEIDQLKNEINEIKFAEANSNTVGDVNTNADTRVQEFSNKNIKNGSQEQAIVTVAKTATKATNTLSTVRLDTEVNSAVTTNSSAINQSTAASTGKSITNKAIASETTNSNTVISNIANPVLPIRDIAAGDIHHSKSSSTAQATKSEATTDAILTLTAIESIENLNRGLVETSNPVAPLTFDFQIAEIPEPTTEKSSRRLFVNTKALTRHSNIIMRGLPQNKDLHLSKYDEYRSDYSFEINVEKELKNNFSLYAGLGYQKLTNRSQSQENLSFTIFNETELPNGKFRYTENMILDTPLGYAEKQVEFETDESMDGKELSQTSQTTQNLSIINLRLGLKKRIEFKKIAFVPYAAIGSNYIVDNKTSFRAKVFSNNIEETEVIKSAEDLTLLNRHYLTLELGTDLQYQINDKVSIGLNFGYEQSITSLRKNVSGLRTYTNSLITGVSFRTRI